MIPPNQYLMTSSPKVTTTLTSKTRFILCTWICLLNIRLINCSLFVIITLAHFWLTLDDSPFLDGSIGKESTCSAEDTGDTALIPRSGRPPGGGHSKPLQYSCLENTMDRGAWWATVHRVTKSRTQLKWLSTLTSGTCIIGFYGALPLFKIIVVKSMVKWFTIVTIFKV